MKVEMRGSLLFVAAVTWAVGSCSSNEGVAPPGGGAAGSGYDGGNGRDATAGSAGSSGAGPTGGAAGSAGTAGAGGNGATTGGAGGTSSGAGGVGGAAGSAGNGASGGTTGGRAGTGGTAGSSGAGGAAGSAGERDGGATDAIGVRDADGASSDLGSFDIAADGDPARPPCMTSPSQVVVLGDSYINWISHTFPADLAREAGVTHRMYAVGAAAMGSGGVSLIPPQFDQAVAADPNIIAAVMDGGGNDVLVADTQQFPQGAECKNSDMSPSIADCQKIVQKAVDAAITLMNTAADKGVKDVVYFFYPHVPEGTLIGGAHPNAILDYALPRVKATCDEARIRTGGRLTCHFIDLIPVFAGHPEYFALADIHPNPTGSAAMAKAVWAKMKEACVGQPASSGCCRP